jgi:hypothetical protein
MGSLHANHLVLQVDKLLVLCDSLPVLKLFDFGFQQLNALIALLLLSLKALLFHGEILEIRRKFLLDLIPILLFKLDGQLKFLDLLCELGIRLLLGG